MKTTVLWDNQESEKLKPGVWESFFLPVLSGEIKKTLTPW